MMLIPGMQIPGMVVSALSAILPSLLGGEEYKWAPLAGANVQFNPDAGGYSSTATEQLGGKSIAGQYAGVGQTLDAFFKAAGGITDASRAFADARRRQRRRARHIVDKPNIAPGCRVHFRQFAPGAANVAAPLIDEAEIGGAVGVFRDARLGVADFVFAIGDGEI